MNERIEEGLRVILDILDNYDTCSRAEIKERTLDSTINDIIDEIDITNRDINRIRKIVNQLLEEEYDND